MAIENEDQVSVLEGGDGRGAAPKTPEVSAFFALLLLHLILLEKCLV